MIDRLIHCDWLTDRLKQILVLEVGTERYNRRNCVLHLLLFFLGFTSKSHYNHQGSGADHICLTDEPIFKTESEGNNAAKVYGTEYRGGVPLQYQDVACAVCQTQQRNMVMIPGRDKCYPGFTLEYAGYLATDHYLHLRSTHICVDREPEPSTPRHLEVAGKLIYTQPRLHVALFPAPSTLTVKIYCVQSAHVKIN